MDSPEGWDGEEIHEVQGMLESGVMIPERVMEKIFCSITFPYIWKVLLLSRRWAVKFSTAFQPSKYLHDSFREAVTSSSHRWPLYAPVFVHQNRIVGYDAKSRQWLTLIAHPFIPLQFPMSRATENRLVAFAGSLICVVQKDKLDFKILVGNVMNGSWKLLTTPTVLEPSKRGHGLNVPVVRFHAVGSDGYKISILNPGLETSEAYLWDSKTPVWHKTFKNFRRHGFFSRHSVFFSGYTYYVMFSKESSVVKLIKCKTEDENWSSLVTLSIEADETLVVDGMTVCGRCKLLEAGVFLCGIHIMLVAMVEIDVVGILSATNDDTYKPPSKVLQVRVYRLKQTQTAATLVTPSKSPPGMFVRGMRTTFITDGESIYVSQFSISSATLKWSEPRTIHKFDVYQRTWTRIASPPRVPSFPEVLELTPALSAFEPGLNPFTIA
ncbi:hypothetical protein MPTK1_2g04870 [Marchantia polymorpha subsp. ruderalis]|uniref:F-box domain-containing protein n=1 Tax=Marchantia polymorpha TaxID=3197 RepID=A0A2R6X7U7_MARPO|nr:hypothetical protein MARPO_0031s0142 [Marchantia polymorpha]PTQ42177.1 hypothetical protein MARPO_0031s0142 [Marchantia polymorpha]BBN01127.1 hypothetical protein Mp_2g04870 [Marchantia polymorpha subsp. ruderalis]BBN01128.1 hypothetical protein Mp_2g04870 [Marchantia polymorpha subsp. ruderalis]|eukprot:PTQ42176.1 hypothetical protein MARPO_0031s0142 [Marchantia polymorpha]